MLYIHVQSEIIFLLCRELLRKWIFAIGFSDLFVQTMLQKIGDLIFFSVDNRVQLLNFVSVVEFSLEMGSELCKP